jgi:Rieske Fe-S protein
MERRDFLKASCSVCLLGSAALIAVPLSSCSKLPIYKTVIHENKIVVPVSLFAQTNLQIVRPTEFDYDIALQKDKGGTFTAILLRCTHAENELSPTGNGFVCNLHGSRFDMEGLVLKGPAEHSLKKYPVHEDSGNIIILLSK